MNKLTPLQSSVYSLIRKFVKRQEIVLQAMRDLRPDMIMRLERRGDPKLWAEMRLKYSGEPSRGYWGEDDEWEYRLHGIGCQLIHTLTGENIQWDIGSLKQFDPNWFADYVEWLLNTDGESDDVNIIKLELESTEANHDELRAFTFPILEQLHRAGVIKPAKHRYILLRD